MNEAASSVEPEVKTRFATVDYAAAFEKFCTKKMQKWCRSGGHGIYQLSYQRI